MKSIIKKISVIIGILLTQISFSQNFFYNSEQFGVEGSMLGGAVVAGSDESSMTFYNPASIYKASSEVSLSLFQPNITTFGFENFWGAGETNNIDTRFKLKPSLISFKFNIKNLDFAFIKITRNNTRDLFNAQRNLIENNNVNTYFFDYQFTGEDDWLGIGTSLKLTKNLYAGMSQFVSSSDYQFINKLSYTQLDINTNNIAQFINYGLEASYGNIGFISKFGLSLDTPQHDIGLTITTPKYLHFSKRGNYYRTLSNTAAIQNANLIVNNDLSPTIKTPWEFNLGYSFAFKNKKRKLWLNASFHSEIPEYSMSNFTSQNTQYSWKNGSNSVYNISVGYSEKITSNFEVSAGFRTDNFAYENKLTNQNEIRNLILDGNHAHWVLGSKFKIKRSVVLLGLDWGTLVNTPEASQFQAINNLGILSPNLNSLQKNNFSILLTYGFLLDGVLFGKNDSKKI